MSKQQQLDLLNAEVVRCVTMKIEKTNYITELNSAIAQTEAQIADFNTLITQTSAEIVVIDEDVVLFNEIIVIVSATSKDIK